MRRAAAVCVAALGLALAARAQGVEPPPAEARAAAVQRGVAWLLAHQQRDGSWNEEAVLHPTGQTALSALTLVKAGVPVEHASLRRALAFIEAELPATTYTLGCELILLGALRDPARRERMGVLVERLLESRLGGEWGYPLTHSRPTWVDKLGRPDLSNTQYAVLGLRAAHHAGIEVPRKVWEEIFEDTLQYQEAPRGVDPQVVLGRKVSGRFQAAGFRYVSDGSQGASGSMTVAGLTVLGCVREVLGARFGSRRQRQLDEIYELATRWLAFHWSVDANPGSPSWHLYYLYGLERVGSLYAVEDMYGHPWFAEGAARLLETQAENGSWSDSFPDTCFALLFLLRATAASSREAGAAAPVTLSSDAGDAVQLLGVGQPAITLWLGPPSPGLRAAHPAGLFVEAVEYLVDGEPVARVAGDPREPWQNQSFPARHEFTRRGVRRVEARVLLAPDAAGQPAPEPLSTRGFEVDVRYPLEPWMLDFAAARGRNLLRGVQVQATASSQVTEGEGPAAAFDGLQGSRWLVGEGDDHPWLRVELPRKLEVGTIVLSQATPREFYRNYLSRFARAELYLNRDRKPLTVTFESDELRPTRVTLDPPRTIDRLELRLVERAPGTAWPWLVGLAEVALEAP